MREIKSLENAFTPKRGVVKFGQERLTKPCISRVSVVKIGPRISEFFLKSMQEPSATHDVNPIALITKLKFC